MQYPLFELAEALPVEQPTNAPQVQRFSDYVVYVDESGDHGLTQLDPSYPIFVLALCVFHKRHLSEKIIPALAKLKFNYFGHDTIVLHEHEIRKQKGAFGFLSQKHVRQAFLGQLHHIMETSNFMLISCVIDKRQLPRTIPSNPYHIALSLCLDSLKKLLDEKKQSHLLTHMIVECRGKKEDAELELEFRRVCNGASSIGQALPLEIKFADKKTISTGLQLADLVARPVGLSYLRPEQENHTFEVLKQKFFCQGGRANTGKEFQGLGLITYPPHKSTP